MFFQAKLAVMYVRLHQTKPMKSIGFFDEIMQKIQFKIWVGKMTKIFFIRNAPNNIAWSLKVFPYYACDEITLMYVKKIKFSQVCRLL